MNTRPLIGVSGSHNVPEKQLFVRENYLQSVLRAGGLPVLLPHTADEQTVSALLDRLDGLLLAGGVDVDPVHYGETAIPECGEIDPQRDAFELLVTRMALERGMPVFGICRGIQLLAVAMGGTLVQDIEAQLSIPAAVHSQSAPYDAPAHAVRFVQDGLFARITGAQMVMSNSMHHQAIKDAGANLVVEGRSDDGVIEAVRGASGDAVFAVQYHPEYLTEKDERAAALFAHLVRKAKEYAAKKA